MEKAFQLKSGDRLDSFQIVEPLYAGALAQVYRGVDELTRRTVVIKVPSLDIINQPLVYYHFQNEARVLAKIDHPRIVRLIQRDRSAAYSVFEYIPGLELRKHMDAQGLFSVAKARHYILQVAQGLAYLHNCGIIHLDIKPENIIITPMDTVKIVDFGLSRMMGTADVLQEDFTRPHGTPYYAAPEQLKRYRDEPRTDLYSLAMVFYEMLTGRLPFEKTTDLAKVRKRLKDEPVPPRRYRKDIPAEVERFILKSLALAPEARYPTAEAFMLALHAIGVPSPDAEPSVPSEYPFQTDGQCPLRPPNPASGTRPKGIVVALDDNDQAAAVVETALQEALVKGTSVTLLTVVSGDPGDEWTRYADEVKGERWGRRLEQFAQRFRRYGIDPLVRIRTGAPADVIVQTARSTRADLIIMGPSGRNLFKRLLGGRTIDRVLKKAPCRVKVADEPMAAAFPFETAPSTLATEDLQRIDYFMVALWTQQLNWLAALVQGLLSEPLVAEEFDTPAAPLTVWLGSLGAHDRWAFLRPLLEKPQEAFQQTVMQMIAAVREQDQQEMRRLYLTQALPLLCRLRRGLQQASIAIREMNVEAAVEQTQMLAQPSCPIDNDSRITGGPIRQIQAIREYFCAHPDASPDQCLRWLNSEPGTRPSGEPDS